MPPRAREHLAIFRALKSSSALKRSPQFPDDTRGAGVASRLLAAPSRRANGVLISHAFLFRVNQVDLHSSPNALFVRLAKVQSRSLSIPLPRADPLFLRFDLRFAKSLTKVEGALKTMSSPRRGVLLSAPSV